mmetsp:Transcript_49930/g.132721  ORF Transcript_49930/g.132721 Transcript_49930/m.132721 type:complete len:210 (-) Transcript_49930:216-845(-)
MSSASLRLLKGAAFCGRGLRMLRTRASPPPRARRFREGSLETPDRGNGCVQGSKATARLRGSIRQSLRVTKTRTSQSSLSHCKALATQTSRSPSCSPWLCGSEVRWKCTESHLASAECASTPNTSTFRTVSLRMTPAASATKQERSTTSASISASPNASSASSTAAPVAPDCNAAAFAASMSSFRGASSMATRDCPRIHSSCTHCTRKA